VILLVGCGGGGGTPPASTTETISTPSIPTGPSIGNVNETLTYTTGGSISSLGHSVEYCFNWGDGSYSDWLSLPSACHSWGSPGDYTVTAQARSAVNDDILSNWSDSKSLTIEQVSSPLNVYIHYIGIKDAHGGNVQLVVVVGDEDEDKMERILIPPGEEVFSIGDFETRNIERRVFHTPSIKGNLKMTMLAYHRDYSKTDYLTLINWMNWYYGGSIDWLEQLVLTMPEQDELIGYYEYKWYPDENWGIGGNYSRVGHDDFLVWFSIYSDEEPPVISKPTVPPHVTIQSVHIPPSVTVGATYVETVILQNNESCTVPVTLKRYSSVGEPLCEDYEIYPNRQEISIGLFCKEPGTRAITYEAFYKDTKLDSWEGSLAVPPGVFKWEMCSNAYPITIAYSEFEGHLNAGQGTTASVQWLETSYGTNPRFTYGWTFTVYDQNLNAIFSWEGVDLAHDFSFTAPETGLYKIRICKRDIWARSVSMTIQPPSDWAMTVL